MVLLYIKYYNVRIIIHVANSATLTITGVVFVAIKSAIGKTIKTFDAIYNL